MNKSTLKEMLILVFVAMNIYWCAFWAFIYADSLLTNGGFFTVDCNSIGEGWSEVVLFIVVMLIGFYILCLIFKGALVNE